MVVLTLVHAATVALTAWLGLYLLQRNPADLRLRFAGLGAAAYALALMADLLAERGPATVAAPLGAVRAALLAAPLVFWAAALWHIFRAFTPGQPRAAFWLVAVASLFMALGAGLVLLPLSWLPRAWLLPAISLDFLALGLAVASLQAADDGEALLDMIRSFNGAALAVLVFAGPVVLTMFLATGESFAMLALLLTIVVAAVVTQVYADAVQAGLDRLSFSGQPRLQRARADLRAVATALPRATPALDPSRLDEAEFSRLTRRALSHLNDLSRLTSSPLMNLPLVSQRLAERGADHNTLERAAELRVVMLESIERLKPRGAGEAGFTDDWRHYNVLYFPYVLGLKPYARPADANGLPPSAYAALDWLRTSVPERTLYNWQTTAARLVARDLIERQAVG